MHIQSVWREPATGQDQVGVGQLWAKCKCGWSGYGRSYEAIASLCEEHREDAERNEALEAEEAQHA